MIMKSLFYVIVAVLLSAMSANSQVLEKGDNAINLGIGIPHVYLGDFGWPSISASYEHGFSPKVGIGYISGGAILSVSGGKTKHVNKSTYTSVVIGPRVAYHFDFYDMTNNSTFNQFDIYAGVFAGIRISSDPSDGVYKDKLYKPYKFEPEIFVGARYYTNSAFGFYLEAGHGVSYLSGGVTFRF